MLLATVAGILIVGVGGGLIVPMRTRLEGALNRAADEAQNVKQTAQSSQGKSSTVSSSTPATTQPTSTRT